MATPNSLPFPPSPEDGDTVIRGDLIGVYHKDINTWAIHRLKEAPTLKMNVVENWSAKAWSQGAIVLYNGQEYYAMSAIAAGGSTPNTAGSGWKNISQVRKIEDLTDVDRNLPTTAGQVLIWDGSKYAPGKVGGTVATVTATQVGNQTGATDADQVAAAFLLKTSVTAGKGDVIIVTATNTQNARFVGAWFHDGTQFIKSPGGSGGSTTEQYYRAATSTVQATGKNIGDVDLVTEALKHQINVFDGTTWQEVLGEVTIKAWVAAGSLFQGVIPDIAGIGNLPAPAAANRGFYWTWTGPASTPVVPLNFTNGGGLTATLQVGDWIQSDGTKFVHVPSDLMSKLRWKAVGSFVTWSDTNYEVDTLVVHNGRFYRASNAVTTGDPAPDDPANTAWVDITPTSLLSRLGDVDLTTNPPTNHTVLAWDQLNANWSALKLSLGDLDKMNLNVINPGGRGVILQWDDVVGEWVASDTAQLGALRFDDAGIGPEITGFASNDFQEAGPDEANFVPSVFAVKEYIKGNYPNLEELNDCAELKNATEGQVPVWNDTLSQWEPKTLTSPIIYLGTGAWDASKVASKADNYGMPADTQPDPKTWAPIAGDQYIDLTTGDVTVFTAATGTNPASPPDRNVGNVIGGASPKDLVPDTLNDLSDVTITTPATNQLLRFNTDHWENWTPDYYNATTAYSKVEIDTKLTTLTTTLEHEESVMAIANDPPAVPTLNDLYITGTVPTGLWAGHAGKLARWDGTTWQFSDPRTNETHLVEDVAETWHWNGTAWVKVAAATTATAVSTTPVGTIIQSVLTPQQFQTAMGADGSKWRLAAGGDCTGTAYATLTGATTLPDLRGSFLRMAGQSLSGWDGGALNGFTEDSTARPKNAFTGSTNSAGGHTHNLWSRRMNAYSGAGYYSAAQTVGEGISAGGVTDVSGRWMDSDGAHDHTVTINGGGDAETKPKSYAVNYFIKVN